MTVLLLLSACVIIGEEQWSERIDWDQDGTANASDCAPHDAAVDVPSWWLDGDGDGVGGGAERVQGCEAPVGYVAETGDCDDSEPSVYPGAVELCDGLDNDCNGEEDDAEHTNPWYTDEVCRLELEDARTVLVGEQAGDNAGRHLSHPFDHDGDGLMDVFTAGPSWGEDDAGRGYVLYGPLPEGEVDLGDSDATFEGQPDDRLARRLAAGDLDGDGADELAVTALRRDHSVAKDGVVFIYAGGTRLDGVVDESTALATISGSSSWSRLGFDVEFPGDLTGDGTADLLVSSIYDEDNLGVVYLMAGPLSDGDTTEAAATITGVFEGSQLGTRLYPLGDLDGDGEVDLALTDPEEERVWLFWGPVEGDIDTDDADVEWLGDSESSTGTDLGVAGDWTGDGHPDLVVSAPSDSSGDDRAGAVFLLDGSSEGGLVSDQAVASFVGEQPFDNAGHAVSSDGDVNGDEVPDLLIGANYYGANDPGIAYLVYGGPTEGVHSLRLADARFEGNVAEQAGSDVVIAGDLDGDGSAELLISSPAASENGSGSGSVWVLSATW